MRSQSQRCFQVFLCHAKMKNKLTFYYFYDHIQYYLYFLYIQSELHYFWSINFLKLEYHKIKPNDSQTEGQCYSFGCLFLQPSLLSPLLLSSSGACSRNCGQHGRCENDACRCEDGCTERLCDPRLDDPLFLITYTTHYWLYRSAWTKVHISFCINMSLPWYDDSKWVLY